MTEMTMNDSLKQHNVNSTTVKSKCQYQDQLEMTKSNEKGVLWITTSSRTILVSIFHLTKLLTFVLSKVVSTKAPVRRGIVRQPRKVSLTEIDGDMAGIPKVDEIGQIKNAPIKRGIVRQARKLSLITEEIDGDIESLLSLKGSNSPKKERRPSFREEYYTK